MSSSPTIPSCSVYVDASDYTAAGARNFDPKATSYYTVNALQHCCLCCVALSFSLRVSIVPEPKGYVQIKYCGAHAQGYVKTVLPGAIVGVVCWVFLLIYFIWVSEDYAWSS